MIMDKEKAITLLQAFGALCGQSSAAKKEAESAIYFIEQQAKQIEAAEKVCDAVGEFEKHCSLGNSERMGLAWKAWQEVKRCADQQQKKS